MDQRRAHALAGALGETFEAAAYEAAGPGPFPISSTVIKRHTALHPWISMVDGFDLRDLTSRFDISTKGRMRYFNDVLTNVFGAVCVTVGTPMIVLDVPSDGIVQARLPPASTTTRSRTISPG